MISSIILQAQLLSKRIRNKQTELLNILTQIESYNYAQDEIKRATSCLDKFGEEKRYLLANQKLYCSSFMPINQPLYGLILFGIIPSFNCRKTFIRPSADTADYVIKISEILSIDTDFKNIEIKKISRNFFIKEYVSCSDVVIFIGKYDNAEKIIPFLKKDCLFLYSGSGMNPFVITTNANLELAVEKAVEARLYNSGQDCAAPNVFLVKEELYNKFISLLINKVSFLKTGDYKNSQNINGPLIREVSFSESVNLLIKNHHKIIYGGQVDIKNKTIYPTIIKTSITDRLIYEELFSPVFTIAIFERDIDLKQYFWDERYYKYSMYVSLFGDLANEKYLNQSIILQNKSVLDEEQGNKPFGGYGEYANYAYYKNRKVSHPILISKEMYFYFSPDNR